MTVSHKGFTRRYKLPRGGEKKARNGRGLKLGRLQSWPVNGIPTLSPIVSGNFFDYEIIIYNSEANLIFSGLTMIVKDVGQIFK